MLWANIISLLCFNVGPIHYITYPKIKGKSYMTAIIFSHITSQCGTIFSEYCNLFIIFVSILLYGDMITDNGNSRSLRRKNMTLRHVRST